MFTTLASAASALSRFATMPFLTGSPIRTGPADAPPPFTSACPNNLLRSIDDVLEPPFPQSVPEDEDEDLEPPSSRSRYEDYSMRTNEQIQEEYRRFGPFADVDEFEEHTSQRRRTVRAEYGQSESAERWVIRRMPTAQSVRSESSAGDPGVRAVQAPMLSGEEEPDRENAASLIASPIASSASEPETSDSSSEGDEDDVSVDTRMEEDDVSVEPGMEEDDDSVDAGIEEVGDSESHRSEDGTSSDNNSGSNSSSDASSGITVTGRPAFDADDELSSAASSGSSDASNSGSDSEDNEGSDRSEGGDTDAGELVACVPASADSDASDDSSSVEESEDERSPVAMSPRTFRREVMGQIPAVQVR